MLYIIYIGNEYILYILYLHNGNEFCSTELLKYCWLFSYYRKLGFRCLYSISLDIHS